VNFMPIVRWTLTILAFLACLGVACPGRAQTPNGANSQSTDDSTVKDAVGIDEKLGQFIPLDLTLRDEDGKPVALRALVDRPTLLTLNYFRCASICSPQLNGLADALNNTKAIPGQAFQILTVSFDERDTPLVAAQKRTNYLLEVRRTVAPTAWRFLTGDTASTRALANAVGFNFKKVGADFAHPAALIVLSPKGKITRYMYGITYVPADLEMAVQEAARGEVQPTINKWLRYCFSYDPARKTYAVNITRLTGALVLGGAMIFGLVLIIKGQREKKAEKPE